MKDDVVFYYDVGLNYPANPFTIPNSVYDGINFILSKLLNHDFLKSDNPFSTLASKGDTIVIKPNFVTIKDSHFELNKQRQIAVTTNRSILIPFIEYSFRAVGNDGRIIIADSPIEASDFNDTVVKLGIMDVINYFKDKKYPVELIDLRDFRVNPITIIDDLKIKKRSFNLGLFKYEKLDGDQKGYTCIDLKKKSLFHNYNKIEKLRFYKPHFKKPLDAHKKNSHKYMIANSILNASLIINLPKMKTHKIAGVTLALKNNIGLTNKKFWLPHYTQGYPPYGDQFDRKLNLSEKIQNLLRVIPIGKGNSLFLRFPVVDEKKQLAKMPINNGSWIGNDTLWRTIRDIALIIEYANKNGEIKNSPQRNILNIIDGIIAGEGNGPLGATMKHCGLLAGSLNMYNLDLFISKSMGFNISKIKYLNDLKQKKFNVIGNADTPPVFNFKPPFRWEDLVKK